jgi:hypothetical protein
LCVAAYLRCLYASIEFAPTVEGRKKAIRNLRDEFMFRTITQLCDSTDWDEKCNIASKYLRVMRSIIKLEIDQPEEKLSMLTHYELVAIVIQITLGRLIDKMKKDVTLTDGDRVTAYEVALTLLTIVQQCNYFRF